jgi:signal transduction histidine kinase
MAQTKAGEYDKAEASLLEALEMSKQLEDKYSTAFDLMALGDLEKERKMYREADIFYVQSVERCLELQNYNMLSVIYDKLYQLHRGNNPALSLKWLENGILVDDSLYNLEMHNQISAFQIGYETEKKEMQITTLEEEKRLMIWLSVAGGTVLLITLAAFFFLWRWTVQKKRLAESRTELAEREKQLVEQQIKQLEQEKQLIATQAVLDGEIQERIRLARDLHDSLGSILAAAKYSLLGIKQISTLGEKDMECYNKTVNLLDDSMDEMRRVAHHLMPEALSRFGLKPAIGDFCDTLPDVQFIWYGDESRLDAKLEEVVYRIIHELISNALKHSGASHIFVQTIQEIDRIVFTVKDNGGGFDPETVATGMGLSNIRIRVASFGGIINIDSNAGEGTEINIEFPLKVENVHKAL